MNKGCVGVSVALFAVSIACVATAVVQAIARTHGLGSLRFWLLVGAHALTAIIAALLLAASRGGAAPKPQETRP